MTEIKSTDDKSVDAASKAKTNAKAKPTDDKSVDDASKAKTNAKAKLTDHKSVDAVSKAKTNVKVIQKKLNPKLIAKPTRRARNRIARKVVDNGATSISYKLFGKRPRIGVVNGIPFGLAEMSFSITIFIVYLILVLILFISYVNIYTQHKYDDFYVMFNKMRPLKRTISSNYLRYRYLQANVTCVFRWKMSKKYEAYYTEKLLMTGDNFPTSIRDRFQFGPPCSHDAFKYWRTTGASPHQYPWHHGVMQTISHLCSYPEAKKRIYYVPVNLTYVKNKSLTMIEMQEDEYKHGNEFKLNEKHMNIKSMNHPGSYKMFSSKMIQSSNAKIVRVLSLHPFWQENLNSLHKEDINNAKYTEKKFTSYDKSRRWAEVLYNAKPYKKKYIMLNMEKGAIELDALYSFHKN